MDKQNRAKQENRAKQLEEQGRARLAAIKSKVERADQNTAKFTQPRWKHI